MFRLRMIAWGREGAIAIPPVRNLNLMGLLGGVVQSHPVFRQGTGFAIAA